MPQWLSDTLNMILPTTFLVGLLIGLAELWLRLRFSHILAKELEDYKKELSDRAKAAVIAEALAEWASTSNASELCPAQKKQLNKLVWEATLWLPDDTALELSKLMYYAKDHKHPKEILVMAKKHIHGKSELDAQAIVGF